MLQEMDLLEKDEKYSSGKGKGMNEKKISSPDPSSPRTCTTLRAVRAVRGEGRELIVKVKDANAPSAVKFVPSGNSHGHDSFSDVVRRASEFPELVSPVMFAPHGYRRGVLAATDPLVSSPPRLAVVFRWFTSIKVMTLNCP